LLPYSERFKITLDIEAKNINRCPVIVEMVFKRGNDVIRTERIKTDEGLYCVNLVHALIYESSGSYKENSLSIILKSAGSLEVISGKLSITKL